MTRRLISSGSTFEKSIGYSRAVVDGDWIFVSGTTGFDYSTMTIQDDAVAQCEQALKNIEAALKQAGCRLRRRRARALPYDQWPRTSSAAGPRWARPSARCARRATMMVVGLADPRMKIEIEVTALRRRRKDDDAEDRAEARQDSAGSAQEEGEGGRSARSSMAVS